MGSTTYVRFVSDIRKDKNGNVLFHFKGKPCILLINLVQPVTDVGIGVDDSGLCKKAYNTFGEYFYLRRHNQSRYIKRL